jgi:hypothetical protein
LSAETTHELYELMGIKKILDGYRGGTYYATLNKYVDERVMELLKMTPATAADPNARS